MNVPTRTGGKPASVRRRDARARRALLAVLAVLSALVAASPAAAHGRYKTTAHDILDVESELLPVRPSEYAFVDSVIDAAKRQVPATPRNASEVLAAFQSVDRILVSRNVIYPGIGLVQYLHDGLTPRQLSDADYQAALANPHNQRRLAAMAANKGKPFYVLDCDTASFLYLAVADALKWPIRLIEVPQHNFVRWTFADGSHLNFETMDGAEMSDDHYLVDYQVPSTTVKPGFFMWPMSHDDVLGYVRMLAGGGWELKSDFVKAKHDFALARHLRPGSPAPLNAESWDFATCTPATCRNGALAVSDATGAVTLWRTGDYLDTLACAQASSGDFASALANENAALGLSWSKDMVADLQAIRSGQVCANQAAMVAALAVRPELLPLPGLAGPAVRPAPPRRQGND